MKTDEHFCTAACVGRTYAKNADPHVFRVMPVSAKFFIRTTHWLDIRELPSSIPPLAFA